MTQYQQNWNRINSELHKAVDRLDGPIDGREWSEYPDYTRNIFAAKIEGILKAELSHRAGDENRVNVKIREALEAIGELLVRSGAARERAASDV